jgi:hypothetical protein
VAILRDAGGEYLTRSTSLPSSTAFSICGFFAPTSAAASSVPFLFALQDASNGIGCAYKDSAGDLVFLVFTQNSYDDDIASFTGVYGQHYFAGMTLDATTATLYVGSVGVSDALVTATVAGSTFTPDVLRLFDWNAGNPVSPVAGVKAWDATLTAAEIERERCVLRPIRTADLHLWTPMLASSSASDAAKDYSGNGRDWTVNGSPTITDGTPVGWGAPIWIPQYARGIPVLSLPSMSSITATTGVPRVTLTF